MALYAGLISGTSMDGVEAVLLEIGAAGPAANLQVRAAIHHDYPPALGQRLRSIVAAPHTLGIDEYGRLDVEVGHVFADALRALLRFSGFAAGDLRAVGSHGQTLLHRPRGVIPFTLQIGDPTVIAEACGIDVVADFRRRDIAAGGEGAPLAPAFHAAAFSKPGETRVVVNIGGISNVTLLESGGHVAGFDTGPGNCLMDLWAEEQLHEPFDRDGAYAASGCVHQPLLLRMLAEPYLTLPFPKSSGRELFNRAWLDNALAGLGLKPQDVQATLCEYTARTICDAILDLAGMVPVTLLVCGGGAYNAQLMLRLSALLAARVPGVNVSSTASCGIAPEHVEGALFAWLAHRFAEGRPGNLPAVSGACGPRVLGALHRGTVTNL
ncbi:MAG TPA: anhydro-N-acetylmuramic acid kinase [Steroidobacteraceae bacterium]|jgi:anhydro-N-acetylmuramic acid kinase|nr:anhydro-N-acetylmuramic acid kinase [Steroidobacteraceae bacterium]